jgi:hypothetical protein
LHLRNRAQITALGPPAFSTCRIKLLRNALSDISFHSIVFGPDP